MEPSFDYWEVVRLLEDHPDNNLKAGDAGYVWGVYERLGFPTEYEADFYGNDGTGIAMMFSPGDVELVDDPMSARIPDNAREFWQREAQRHPKR